MRPPFFCSPPPRHPGSSKAGPRHPGPALTPRLFRSRASRRKENIAPPPATSPPRAIRIIPNRPEKRFHLLPPPSRTAPPAPPIRPAVSKEVVPAPEPPPFIHVRTDAPKVPDTRIPHQPQKRRPAPLSDSLLTRPTQAPPLATPQRPKKRHPASRRPPPRAFPHLQVPPLPGRHKKSGSPLKAAALRSNRRAISYP